MSPPRVHLLSKSVNLDMLWKELFVQSACTSQIPEFPRSLCFLRHQCWSSRVTVASAVTPHELLLMSFTPWVTEEVGDGKMTSSSLAPCELEEHFHTFPILCSSGGSESLALGRLHTRAAVRDTQCSRGGP